MEQIQLYENSLYENLIEAQNYQGIQNYEDIANKIFQLFQEKNLKYFFLEKTNNYNGYKKIYLIKSTDLDGITSHFFIKDTVATISVDPYFNGKENKIHIHGTIKSSSGYYTLDKHFQVE